MIESAMEWECVEPAGVGDSPAQAPVCIGVRRASGSNAQKRNVLLIPGNPATMADWDELADPLAPHLNLAAVDLPGFGKSFTPVRTESSLIEHTASSVNAALQLIGWQRQSYYIVGHSHGAGVALLMASLFPERVAGIILLSTLGCSAHAAYKQLSLPGAGSVFGLLAWSLRRGTARGVSKALIRAVISNLFRPSRPTAKYLDIQLKHFEQRPEALKNMVALATDNPCARVSDAASHVRCPVLIIHGREDRIVPVSLAAELTHRLSPDTGGVMETLESAGHMLHQTHARELAPRIVGWIERSGERLHRPQGPA